MLTTRLAVMTAPTSSATLRSLADVKPLTNAPAYPPDTNVPSGTPLEQRTPIGDDNLRKFLPAPCSGHDAKTNVFSGVDLLMLVPYIKVPSRERGSSAFS